jgi:hypothetical protein
VKCIALFTGAKIVPPRNNSEAYGSVERPAVRPIDRSHGWSADPRIIARKSLLRFHADEFAVCLCRKPYFSGRSV